MALVTRRLKPKDVESSHPAGTMLHDGGGLYLAVGKGDARSWVFRYRTDCPIDGTRLRKMGLGSVRSVTLAEARDRADELRRIVATGRDPQDEKAQEQQAALERERAAILAEEKAGASTFRALAEAYISGQEAGWKNEKHRQQWRNTLATYAYPSIGASPVSKITVDDIIGILRPIWNEKPETASRIRGRIEKVIGYGIARAKRDGGDPETARMTNPARWSNNLEFDFTPKAKVRRVEHHGALPFAEVPDFMARLSALPGPAARALQFVILTAARTSEVLLARWSEVDEAAGLWVVPADRMKAGRMHRVPLTPAALEVLRLARLFRRDDGDFIFPGEREGRPLSNMAMLNVLKRMKVDVTTHGFRSSFRDWAAETTNHDRDAVEMALAHTIGSKVEAAYRRGDMLEKRRPLMADWSAFCTSSSVPVAPLSRSPDTIALARRTTLAARKERLARLEAERLIAGEEPVKRGRGRPRKVPIDPLDITPTVKRPRGRPRKAVEVDLLDTTPSKSLPHSK